MGKVIMNIHCGDDTKFDSLIEFRCVLSCSINSFLLSSLSAFGRDDDDPQVDDKRHRRATSEKSRAGDSTLRCPKISQKSTSVPEVAVGGGKLQVQQMCKEENEPLAVRSRCARPG